MGQKEDYKVAVVNTTNSDSQFTVAAGATVSSILECGGTAPAGLFLPSAFVSCNITIKVCKTPSGTFVPLTNFDGSAFSIAANPSTFTPLLPAMFNSVLYMQLSFDQTQTTAEIIDTALIPIFQGIHA